MVSQQGVGDWERLAHRRLEGASLSRVPEDLIEEAKVEAKRVVRLVAQHRQGRIDEEVGRS